MTDTNEMLQSLNRAWACSDGIPTGYRNLDRMLQSLNRAWACSDNRLLPTAVVTMKVAIPQSGVGLF